MILTRLTDHLTDSWICMNQSYRKMNHLWNIWDEDTEENEKKSQELMEQQQALFLFGDPELVINVIQFMQFGYAIALSVVFVYWDDMQKDDDFDASAYLVATLLCYSVFLIVMARVMPLYTVCTSLGQLVDKQRLHEVRAAFHLEEAERLRHEQHFPGATNSKRSSSGLTKKTESYNSLHSLDPTAKEQSSDESTMSVPMVVPKLLENASVSQDSSTRQSSDSKTSVDEVKLLANLVKMDTKSLRQIVPPPEKPENSTRGSRVSREHQRSFSDGIQSMRNLGNLSFSSMEDNSNKELHKAESSKKVTFDDAAVAQAKTLDHRQRRERRRSQSASATIQAMRDVNYDGPLNSSLGNIAEDAPNEDDPKVADDVQALPSKKAPATTGTPVVANVLDVVPEQELMNDFSFNEEDDDSMSQLSDVEQNTLTIWEKKTNHEQVEHETVSHSLKQRICNFFDGPSYIFVTNILGTMICFFLIGMRVEGFVKKQCIIPWDDYSWDLTLDFSFRLLVAWFSSFIGVSLILVFLSQNLRKRYMFFAGVIDIILSTICLVLLLEAEKQRCCNDGIDVEESLLEEDLYDFRLLKESDACYDVTLECSCAEFGHRMSGGLGSMEPFTALIALRVFRFGLAKRLTNFFRSKDDDSHGHHSYNHGHGHDHGHGEELGSAVELWQHAIAKAPDIVEKYGEFSSELLQVMLGIEVIESTPVSTAPKELKDRSAEESSTESAVGVPVSSEPERGHVVLEEKKYKKLKPEVQEIIAAGRMGLPVKPCLAASSKSEIQRPSSRAVAPMAPLEFKVDKKSAQLEHEHANSTLSFPNATLVRSMRRCERKLLPLLNKWTTVDVVITNHEMVYVDVHDAGDSELREDELAKCKASKEAVKATHGGKGLRLCDVTAGRRIVGHLSFNDVISVHVEREPAATSASTDDEENDVDIVVREHNEFWQPNTNTESSFESKQKRWDKVNQDRLRLHTAHGTMYLRFHSDLVDSELHPERVIEEVGDESPLHKDIAFQWAQTIVWNCGAGQLHQALPHFGDDNGDELRDYLQIVPKVKQHGHNRRLASFTPHFDRVQSFSIRRKGSRGQHHRSPSPVKRRGRSPPPASRLQSKSPPPPSRREDTAEEEKKEPKENIVVEC